VFSESPAHSRHGSIVGDALKTMVNLDNLNLSPTEAKNPFAETFADVSSNSKLGETLGGGGGGEKKNVMMAPPAAPQQQQQQQQQQWNQF